jgi:predicted DNA binding CopG/RHH family protein
MKKINLDKYEGQIEEEAGKYTSISKSKNQQIKKIIDKTHKKISVTLRLDNQDLELIKTRAAEEGLAYQTLISSILHKFVSNQLIDDKNLIKIIKMVRS